MRDASPTSKKFESGEIIPIGYQQVNFHMIFDVKMEDFRRKDRLMEGGHVTEPPETITYERVLPREMARIALILAALNDLPV